MAEERNGVLAFIRRLPKIDLHLHLEGSLSPSAVAALARRHRCSIPDLRGFQDFDGFLEAFGAVCDLMRDEDDFRFAVEDVLWSARRQRIVHLEMRISPQVFMRRGISLHAMMRGLLLGRLAATRRHGVSSVFIVDGVRQWGAEWYEEMVRALSGYAGRGIGGIGLGGKETSLDAGSFAAAFRRGRQLGLGSTVHAGETGGPDSVRSALESLRADRIGHGVASIRDEPLIRTLARGRVPLEVCPTSNVSTGVVGSLGAHPVRKLFDAGVPIVVGSDDGAFFGTNLTRELEILASRFGFTREEIGRIMLNAAQAAFLGARKRRTLEAGIRGAMRRMACG